MGLLGERPLRYFSKQLARHQVNVIALPITNAWLLGRKQGQTSIQRPIAPIIELQNAGVNVAIGGDNVKDRWYPSGNFDQLSLMSSSISMAHVVPWKRLGLCTYTTAPSKVMGLKWDGSIEVGSSADFVELEADS